MKGEEQNKEKREQREKRRDLRDNELLRKKAEKRGKNTHIVGKEVKIWVNLEVLRKVRWNHYGAFSDGRGKKGKKTKEKERGVGDLWVEKVLKRRLANLNEKKS